jgi:hypothetical protein
MNRKSLLLSPKHIYRFSCEFFTSKTYIFRQFVGFVKSYTTLLTKLPVFLHSSLILSAISAINSEFVGFPLFEFTVYPNILSCDLHFASIPCYFYCIVFLLPLYFPSLCKMLVKCFGVNSQPICRVTLYNL